VRDATKLVFAAEESVGHSRKIRVNDRVVMNGQLDTRRALGGDFLSDRPVSNAPNTGWNDARLPGNQTVESIVAFFRVDLKIGRRLKRLRDVTDVCLGKHDGQELVVARPSPV